MHEQSRAEQSRRIAFVFCILAASVSASSCTADDLDVVAAPIIGDADHPDPLDQDPERFPGVVTMFEPFAETGVGVCSGTLISPSHVLTAAHCASHTLLLAGPQTLRWETGIGTPTARLDVDEGQRIVRYCRVHPALRRDGGDPALDPDGDCAGRDTVMGPYDVAVVVLETPVPPAWAPAELGRIRRNFHRILGPGEAPTIGDRVAHVGYGLLVTRALLARNPGYYATIGFRRAVDRAIGSISSAPEIALLATGDESVGSGSSGGDSGGPILWLDAPADPLWGPPPAAIHSNASFDHPSQRGTYLGTAETRAFLTRSLDRNHDGRFDYWCPPNPAVPGVAVPEHGDGWRHGFNPAATPDNDHDGDGYLDTEDIAPNRYNPCQEDRDEDGVWDVLDLCPNHADPDQIDRDGDGEGDACDRCPDATRTFRDSDLGPGVDFDLSAAQPDGIPDECDVCPTVYDPDQENCNLDAELAVRAREEARGVPEADRTPLRGDACDPTPCGETTVGLTLSGFEGPTTTLRHDSLRVDAVTDWADVPLARSRVVDAREGFRFCRCPAAYREGDTTDAREACARPVPSDVDPFVTLGNCAISDTEQYDSPSELALTWRWMDLEAAAEDVRTREPGTPLQRGLRAELPARHEARAPDALYQTDLRIDWSSESEATRWAGVFPGDPDPRESAGLDGVLWTHTARGFGASTPTWSRELSSHYWSGRIPQPYRAARRFPPPCAGPVVGLAYSSSGCSFCGGMISTPYFVTGFRVCPHIGPDFFVDIGNFLVDPDELPPNLPFSRANLEVLFGWEGRWSVVAEPPTQLPARGLRYVAMAHDLSGIGRVIIETDDGLRDVLANCIPGQCGDPIDPPTVRSALAERVGSSIEAPSPRTGFSSVLSAARGELFVLGGIDASGHTLRDAWALDVLRNRWRRLDLAGAELGGVLAATFDASSGDLLVLDEVTRGRGRGARREARLVRVDPADLAVEVVGSWPRLTGNDRFALASGNDGALYIAASGRAGAHLLLRLAPSRFGTFRIAGLVAGVGRIFPEQLRVGLNGVTTLVEHGRSYRSVSYEERSFVRVPRAFDRCF